MSLAKTATCETDEAIQGVIIDDPFRWLEHAESPATRSWIQDQTARLERYLAGSDNIDLVRELVRRTLDVETVDQPRKIKDRYFYRKRKKGAQVACIYIREVSTNQERLLIDPSTKGAFTSVGIHGVSFDGAILAYQLRRGGADVATIHFVDVESGLELHDLIESGYARGFTFADDASGVYYCQDCLRNTDYHEICFHKFGSEDADEIVLRRPKSRGTKLRLSSDHRYLGALYVCNDGNARTTEFLVAERRSPKNWTKVVVPSDDSCQPFISAGRLFAISTQNAPHCKLIALGEDGSDNRVIIPEYAEAIKQLVIVGRHIVITRIHGWGMVVEAWTVFGQFLGPVDIPADGTVLFRPTEGSDVLFCTYESFGKPLATYELSPGSGTLTLWHQQSTPIDTGTYHTESTSVVSKDGTNIPLMLVSKSRAFRGINMPTLLTGYGGFGTSATPQYSILVSIMMELGCVFALARIRGGGEFGKEWHEAGRRTKRQNAFDDFIASAEWLCSEGVTSPTRLALLGGSNSGLLVAVAVTQRPELFAAVVCIAPLLDMLRYEQFDRAPRWVEEYGSVNDIDDFRALFAYSPYHHIQENTDYPSILFISGDSDDRCNPAHVRKMAARLQSRCSQTRQILVEYSAERGHSPSMPLAVRLESLARRITFLCRELNIACEGSHND